MSADEVRKSSWGKPKSVNVTITAGGEHEQWVYGGGYSNLRVVPSGTLRRAALADVGNVRKGLTQAERTSPDPS